MATYLSPHFTKEEVLYSDTAKRLGIDNSPTPGHLKTLIHTCQYLGEPLRALLNAKYTTYGGKKVKYVSIKVTSGYRGRKLNEKVGGSSTSQHCTGEALDIEATIVFADDTKKVLPYTTLYSDIKEWVRQGKLSVDQCIQEASGGAYWVHVSHSAWGASRDRKQFLKYNGKTYTLDCTMK